MSRIRQMSRAIGSGSGTLSLEFFQAITRLVRRSPSSYTWEAGPIRSI